MRITKLLWAICPLCLCTALCFQSCSNTPESNDDEVGVELIRNPNSAHGYDEQMKMPVISFETETHDFGRLTAGESITYSFRFTNTGNADLYIHQIITSCSCTGRKYPTHAIKPGATDTIFVTYNAENKSPRRFRTSITIHSNAVNEMTKLYLKGEIMPKEVKENEAIEIE